MTQEITKSPKSMMEAEMGDLVVVLLLLCFFLLWVSGK